MACQSRWTQPVSRKGLKCGSQKLSAIGEHRPKPRNRQQGGTRMLRKIMQIGTMRGMGVIGCRRLLMIGRVRPIAIVMLAVAGWSYGAQADPGDAARGEQEFRACAP